MALNIVLKTNNYIIGAHTQAPEPGGTPPESPTNLDGSAPSSGLITLTWDEDSLSEDNFVIERSIDGEEFAVIASVGADVVSYNDTTVEESITYYYRVKATNVYGSSGYTNTFSIESAAGLPPISPSNLTATVIDETHVDLAWTDNSDDEATFSLEQSTNGSDFVVVNSAIAEDATSLSLSSLTENTNYSWRLSAVNANGTSATSNITSATTPASSSGPPTAPTGLTATAVSQSQINLSWTNTSSTATGVKIERATGAGAYSQIAVVTNVGNTYSSTGLNSSTLYRSSEPKAHTS